MTINTKNPMSLFVTQQELDQKTQEGAWMHLKYPAGKDKGEPIYLGPGKTKPVRIKLKLSTCPEWTAFLNRTQKRREREEYELMAWIRSGKNLDDMPVKDEDQESDRKHDAALFASITLDCENLTMPDGAAVSKSNAEQFFYSVPEARGQALGHMLSDASSGFIRRQESN